jgi:hypothetical protein
MPGGRNAFFIGKDGLIGLWRRSGGRWPRWREDFVVKAEGVCGTLGKTPME